MTMYHHILAAQHISDHPSIAISQYPRPYIPIISIEANESRWHCPYRSINLTMLSFRYSEIAKRLSVVCSENENLLLRCRQLSDVSVWSVSSGCRGRRSSLGIAIVTVVYVQENEILHKDGQHWQAQDRENELMMREFKKVASEQVTVLQTERDQLELVRFPFFPGHRSSGSSN